MRYPCYALDLPLRKGLHCVQTYVRKLSRTQHEHSHLASCFLTSDRASSAVGELSELNCLVPNRLIRPASRGPDSAPRGPQNGSHQIAGSIGPISTQPHNGRGRGGRNCGSNSESASGRNCAPQFLGGMGGMYCGGNCWHIVGVIVEGLHRDDLESLAPVLDMPFDPDLTLLEKPAHSIGQGGFSDLGHFRLPLFGKGVGGVCGA
jgi:hypothetical protein